MYLSIYTLVQIPNAIWNLDSCSLSSGGKMWLVRWLVETLTVGATLESLDSWNLAMTNSQPLLLLLLRSNTEGNLFSTPGL